MVLKTYCFSYCLQVGERALRGLESRPCEHNDLAKECACPRFALLGLRFILQQRAYLWTLLDVGLIR